MTSHAIAVDVGGTETKAALVAVEPDDARTLRQTRRRTPRGADGPSTAESVIDTVAEIVEELRDGADAIGVVVPGIVDEQRGMGVYSANLGWREEPLRDMLAARFDLPLAFGHDVRAGGLAEARFGAARGMRDVIVMPIGTGIAAALVFNGQIYSAGGHAGEIGHVDIGHGEPCPCGGTGCVEAVASSAAVARRYTARVGTPVDGAAAVADAVRAGDPHAAAVWQEAVDALAKGLVTLTAVLAPEGIVLGGGLAMAGRLLTDPLAARLDEMLLPFHRRPRLELAELGDTAGCLGAALLATEGLQR
ncbi:ROK family protein [Saccharopolyspora erythraea]|uniref:ROK family protein n=1 Tax=Saccharopolyspora erythraea TaxID=1836 RepID=UPI001BA94011|nr:ROK family protein [Saccharopolyspora erythraea]QUH05496.1 ROK family protein [Saccharopolyspora erythraea]